jgi:hypothetical protein
LALAALFAFVAVKYGVGLATASLVGAITVIYLLGVILLPGTLTEKGFLAVFKSLISSGK